MAVIILILFLLVILIGVPIAYSMGSVTIFAFFMTGNSNIIIPQKMFSGIDNFTYLCIPLFILASEIMSNCGLTRDIVNFCDALVGRIRGGLAQVNVLDSMIFAGISGSATADATGIGKLEIDMMVEGGYDKVYAASLSAASAIIGPIIPPSNIMIIYAVCAGNVSVSAMFLGGVFPGILLGLVEMALCYYFAVKYHHPHREYKLTIRQKLHAFKNAAPALGLPLIILGGIISGIFTATEASAIAVFYALLIAIIRKRITFKSLYHCCISTGKTTANVLLIIGIASAMSYAITVLRIPQDIVGFVVQYIDNKYMFLLFVNIFLLILGCILDQAPALLLIVPILLPIAMRFGINPVHFGIICCFNLTIGLITPPVGMTLFVTANVAKVKLTDMYRGILPFAALGIIMTFVITYIPVITTFIPRLFGYIK